MSDNKDTKQAIIYILVATFAFACMNALAKQLSDLHPLQIVFFRSLGTFIFIFPYMLYHKITILGTHRKMLLLRAVVGFISLATFFMAVQKMPLGSAISIRYLGPLVSVILAMFFLREKVKGLQWVGFAVAIIGVFVLKGFETRITLDGFILAIISAITVGIVFTLVRFLAVKEHHLTIINFFMMISIFGSLFSIPFWKVISASQILPIMGLGIAGMIGQVCMTIAFKKGDTNTVAPFKYMELIYAIIIAYFFFGESYTLLASAGIALILIGMLINLYSKKTMVKSTT